MKLILQRVKTAKVLINEEVFSSIGNGIAVFLGITNDDDITDIKYSIEKLINLRIFSDSDGKLNLSLLNVKGELMIVSNFTVYGNTKKGRRPSYTESADPKTAENLYNLFLDELLKYEVSFKTGIFREHMNVALENDGPVTLIIDSKN